jgi:hypothetical protein
MANELTLNAMIAYSDAEDADEVLQVADLAATASTLKYVKAKQAIGITEEAIGLGEVTSLGWGLFINRDSTNFIELRVGTGSTKFAKLKAGEFAFFRFGSGVTAPYAIADTSPCQMEYIIVSV